MSVAENLSQVNASIRSAEAAVNRAPDSVRLVAVSKFHPAEAVIEAIDAGQTLFGENRVQEAFAKFSDIASRGYHFDLHIIGTLQRNKVRDAVKIASCIESVDRIVVLDEIEKQCAKINKTIDVFLEVHTGEETKAGFADSTELEKAVSLCAQGSYPHIVLKGLMTMAPNTDDTEQIRNSFRTLRTLRDTFSEKYAIALPELSMGMSGDYPIAIAEGATIVRVGTAIFGARQ
ncbi:MAG: YggS family pyridoxal phosphate-dependent enzyme [Treponema sp.]|nr:YggS family pyridoxal phosphate-dependent enzyme [Treponema sp.]